MQHKLMDLLDAKSLRALLESLYKITGVSTGILDVDGTVFIAIGWQDICVNFHRVCPEAAKLCQWSDYRVKDMLSGNETFATYCCPHGIWGSAAPIVVSGEHLGTVVAGQYLLDEPDITKFKEQAACYGFDEQAYLSALSRVPILNQQNVDNVLTFFQQLAKVLTQTVIAQSRQLEMQSLVARQNEEKYQAIINNMPHVALQSYDREGKVIYWNKASEILYGWKQEEAIGKSLDELMVDQEVTALFHKLIRATNILKRQVGPVEWRIRTKDGAEKNLLSTLFAVYMLGRKEFICMDLDITDRRQFEKELTRLERLNLVGQLAASIGHEVRNPMTIVRGYLQFLKRKEETKSLSRQLDTMIEEIDRANSIITEFLSLAKNKAINPERKNLNDIIKALAPLLEANALAGNHNFDLALGAIPDLLLDEKEIRQLILNLAQNGFEAMQQGGQLAINTYTESHHVVLAIKDEGSGIPATVMERLGTPFVTTKENGTGMGLAVCYSIAARHRAQIEVDNSQTGATFYIKFRVPKAEDFK